MILVDTGPWVALFDPLDDAHQRARKTLEALTDPLVTTVPVLTEVFHLLSPNSRGAEAFQEFIQAGGLKVWWLATGSLNRCFELMARYSDRPMDLADASLVAAAEALRTTKVFTLDRNDFSTYRARIGRSHRGFKVVP